MGKVTLVHKLKLFHVLSVVFPLRRLFATILNCARCHCGDIHMAHRVFFHIYGGGPSYLGVC